MNLGAFMDPEFPIFSTTLCYLEREDAYLMLHRIKKHAPFLGPLEQGRPAGGVPYVRL